MDGRRWGRGALVAGLIALLAGCGSVGPRMSAEAMLDGVSSEEAPAEASRRGLYAGLATSPSPAKTAAIADGRDDESAGDTASAPGADRLMIYEGRFTLVSADPVESISSFVRRVEAAGGYLVERHNQHVACRVPAAKFDETIAQVRASGQVLSEHVTAQEVTREYRDLEIRLENSEKSRARLLALLERAEDVEAILKIEEQLRRLTEDIERMKGELRYLSERLAFSLVAVDYQVPAVSSGRGPTGRPSRFPWINAVGVRAVLERF